MLDEQARHVTHVAFFALMKAWREAGDMCGLKAR
jgi:hypothetical protein